MSKLTNIIKAWGKHLSGAPLTEEQLERAKICSTCAMKSYKTNIDVFADDKLEQINGYVCDDTIYGYNMTTDKAVKGCGCYLPSKVRSTEGGCPLGKWSAEKTKQ